MVCDVTRLGETHGLHLGPPPDRGTQVQEGEVMVIGPAPETQRCVTNNREYES